MIRQQLKAARENRCALAGLFIAETRDLLPNGIGFGQVSECDFYVAFDPEDGDDTLLTCAIWMAKATALATVRVAREEEIDLTGIQREISVIRGLLEQFSRIEKGYSMIDKEVTGGRNAAAGMKAGILTAMRRLESYFTL